MEIAASSARGLQDPSHRSAHSSQELWKWTLTPAALAPCFISDVLAMTQNTDKGSLIIRASFIPHLPYYDLEDFYWLGSIPCRSVLLVAMVVGVQVYERRIVYTRKCFTPRLTWMAEL